VALLAIGEDLPSSGARTLSESSLPPRGVLLRFRSVTNAYSLLARSGRERKRLLTRFSMKSTPF